MVTETFPHSYIFYIKYDTDHLSCISQQCERKSNYIKENLGTLFRKHETMSISWSIIPDYPWLMDTIP